MATLHLGFKNREQGGGGTLYLEVFFIKTKLNCKKSYLEMR